METLLSTNTSNQSYTPQLKSVLKTYQLSAIKSLQGPSSALLGMDYKGLLQEPATFHFSPINRSINSVVDSESECGNPEKEVDNNDDIVTCKDQERASAVLDDSDDDPQPLECSKGGNESKRESEFQIPILTAPDQSCSERCETLLEGERISCFVVGGERRLCLPQILNTVLQDFSLQQINQVCDELQIYCSRCTRDQLEELKLSGILPRNAPSCGLITQTDAERLVSALLLRTDLCDPQDLENSKADIAKHNDSEELSATRFKVYHECFGKCKGILESELFTTEDSACIECLECMGHFSPQRFVRHAHRSLENRTCHWGFDSANWRSYLLLARDQPHYERVSNIFCDLKQRHLPNSKRKPQIQHEPDKLTKRMKKDSSQDCPANFYKGNGMGMYHPMSPAGGANDPYLQMQWAVFELAARGTSAFRPWSVASVAASCKHRDSASLLPSYLSRGPPVLQHPERVVPHSECERFEPHFQPNVALAPLPSLGVPPLVAPGSHHNHPKRRHHLRQVSPEGKEKVVPVSVKLERSPSPSPCPGPGPGHPPPSSPLPLSCSTEGYDDVGRDLTSKGNDEGDESSTAVTSSTVTIEPPPAETTNSSPETDSDSDTAVSIDLETRLASLDVPNEVIALARRLISRNARLRRHRRRDAREISRLRSQLELQQVQPTAGKVEGNEDAVNASASANAADSTECNEETDSAPTLEGNKESKSSDDSAAGNE